MTPTNRDFGGKSQKIAISAEICDFGEKLEKASKIPKNCDLKL
jgi:hypothetical protein